MPNSYLALNNRIKPLHKYIFVFVNLFSLITHLAGCLAFAFGVGLGDFFLFLAAFYKALAGACAVVSL
jgi:hypothetical protein